MTDGAARAFERDVAGARVVFGVGRRESLAAHVAELGAERVLLVGTPRRQAELDRLAERLGERAAARHAGAEQHVPEPAVEAALAACDRAEADLVLAFGGGSAIGLAKALALEREVAVAALPTTYSGSEMTHIWGLTRGGDKVTGRDERVRPRLVVYDPELSVALPLGVTLPSLLNAMAHAAEALYAAEVGEAVRDNAEESVRVIAVALRRLAGAPGDLDGRADALYGAHLAGACLDAAAMGLHHKLAHVLGGRFGMPHAETHAVLLPHVLAYNRDAARDAMARMARALGVVDAPAGLWELAQEVGAPTRLAALGLREEQLDEAAKAACERQYPNPRPVEEAGVRALLEAALDGLPP